MEVRNCPPLAAECQSDGGGPRTYDEHENLLIRLLVEAESGKVLSLPFQSTNLFDQTLLLSLCWRKCHELPQVPLPNLY